MANFLNFHDQTCPFLPLRNCCSLPQTHAGLLVHSAKYHSIKEDTLPPSVLLCPRGAQMNPKAALGSSHKKQGEDVQTWALPQICFVKFCRVEGFIFTTFTLPCKPSERILQGCLLWAQLVCPVAGWSKGKPRPRKIKKLSRGHPSNKSWLQTTPNSFRLCGFLSLNHLAF